MIFNERLKIARNTKGLTQDDLAKLLNITPSAISLYENGDREPNLNTLVNISKILNVSTDYLLGLTDNTDSQLTNDEIIEIINTMIDTKIKEMGLKNADL